MLAPCVPNWRSDSLPSASWCSPCRRGPIMPTATTQSRPSTWKGVVTELHLLTPHSWMYVEVAKPDGQKQLWALEAGGQARLLKIGVSAENSRPGDGLPACLHRRSRSPRRRRRSDRGPDRAPRPRARIRVSGGFRTGRDRRRRSWSLMVVCLNRFRTRAFSPSACIKRITRLRLTRSCCSRRSSWIRGLP